MRAWLIALIALLGLGCGCNSTLVPDAFVVIDNGSGFTVDVYAGDILKLDNLGDDSTGSFFTNSGQRRLRFVEVETGIEIEETTFLLDEVGENRIFLDEVRALVEVTNDSDCCLRVLIDNAEVMDLQPGQTEDRFVPEGSRVIEVETCAGAFVLSRSKLLTTETDFELVIVDGDCAP